MADEDGEGAEEGGDEGVVQLDKEIVFIARMHETLVKNFEVTPVSIRLREDPDIGLDGADFVLDYDLGYGDSLCLVCRREGGEMLVTLISNDREISHSVQLDSYIDDDFMPVEDEEFANLVQSWFE